MFNFFKRKRNIEKYLNILDYHNKRLEKKINESVRHFIDTNESLKNAVYLDSQIIEMIPYNKYIEVAEGVFDRRIKHKGDLINYNELKFKSIVNTIDFSNNVVLFVKMNAAGNFSAHFHSFPETIYCLQGEYIGTMDKKVYRKGDIQKIEKWQVHPFIPLTDGYCLITIPNHYF
jgi:hypothetical protein